LVPTAILIGLEGTPELTFTLLTVMNFDVLERVAVTTTCDTLDGTVAVYENKLALNEGESDTNVTLNDPNLATFAFYQQTM